MNLARPKTLVTILVAAGLVTAATVLPTATVAQASARTAGCGKQAAPTGDYSLVSGGLTRTYRLHLPEKYQAGKAYPLVVVYHGRGKTGAFTEAFTDLSKLDAIVAYPNGVLGEEDKQAWQGAPYAAKGVDDVKFTADLLDRLQAAYCVDTRAVHATGKSNGAGFTGILACVMADRFAAIAPVAGAFYQQGKRCRPSRPVPVLAIHGTGDTTIPYDGDGQRDLPSVQTWVRDWSVRDHCTPDPRGKQLGDDVLVTTYKGCRADVVHVAVTDGGHSWPGSDAASGPGYVTQTFEAHELIGDFFAAHKLRS
ncbi:alpha/beta hydrolase family esterase [Kribbella sp. CA-293567]|uniref:alpha/beta hydrolase family esterase n=1 Tax=Kribbella sp. CA-293567 TaxID=3002436 RepID=UPI0022DCFA2A|nr:PHB depolymerase family esterase [Kribbella sp. CA-293567]WBQ03684.1 prolyl oligopeptidase family serine peptidase [Kribbella sp. CA-293567]